MACWLRFGFSVFYLTKSVCLCKVSFCVFLLISSRLLCVWCSQLPGKTRCQNDVLYVQWSVKSC